MQYLQSTLIVPSNVLSTWSNHTGTALYETYVAGQEESGFISLREDDNHTL